MIFAHDAARRLYESQEEPSTHMHIIMLFAKLMHVLMIAPPLSSECEEIIMTIEKFVNHLAGGGTTKPA